MPFFMAFPWRAELEARWWDFKAALGARGQSAAGEKLASLQAYEQKFQEALGNLDRPYTALGNALLHSTPRDGVIMKLREMVVEFKRTAQVRAETEAHHLVSDLSACRLVIQPTRNCEPPEAELLAMLDGCQGKLNDYLARSVQEIRPK